LPAIIKKTLSIDWTTAVLSPLAVILMEVFWVYAWLVWGREMPSFHWDRTPFSLLSLVFLVVIPFIISRFPTAQKKSLIWVKLFLILLNILIIVGIEYNAGITFLSGQWFVYFGRLIHDSFVHFQPIIVALGVSVYLSWRGIRLGYSNLFFNDVYRSFLFGSIALILLMIIWTTSMGTGSIRSLTSSIGLPVAGYFFFGLIALALGNLLAIRQRMLREKAAPPSNRRWVIILFGIVGGIVVVGGGIASVFSPDFATTIGQVLGTAFGWLSKAIYYLFIPLEYVVAGLIYVVQWLISLIRGGQVAEPFETPALFETGELENALHEAVGVDIVMIIKWVAFAIIVIVAIFLLKKAISRLRFPREEIQVEEISESLWSWPGFLEDLFQFFYSLFARWKPRFGKLLKARVTPVSHMTEDIQNIKDVREMYRHLLWDASIHGMPHRSYETPYEYSGRLVQAIPEGTNQMDELTDLYVNVRYGEMSIEDRKAEQANGLLRFIHQLLGGLRKSGK